MMMIMMNGIRIVWYYQYTSVKFSWYAMLVSHHENHGWFPNSSRNIRPQSSQLAEPLWTDPGIKSGIRVRELSLHKKKKRKKEQGGMNGWTFPPNPGKRGKSHHHHIGMDAAHPHTPLFPQGMVESIESNRRKLLVMSNEVITMESCDVVD